MKRKKKANRIDILLSESEMSFCRSEMRRLGLSCQTDVIRHLIAERMQTSQSNPASKIENVENSISLILNRLSKLERVQRTIVLNTAHARGFAVGFLRTAPPESRKTIEQDVLKNFNEQKEFFFNLFPEQRDGETKEARA